MSKILLGRAEAAAALSISIRELDRLVARGILRIRKIGRRRLVPRTALEQFVKKPSDESPASNAD